jgi:hypothetical protein
MTGTINQTSYESADSSAISVFSTEVALVPVILLMALLVLNEAIRAYRSDRGERGPSTGLYVGILPLTLAAGFIIAVRLLTIMDRI